MKFEHVNRVLLSLNGQRTFETTRALDVQIDLQDHGRTLKVFLKEPDPGNKLSKNRVMEGIPFIKAGETAAEYKSRVSAYIERIVDQANDR